MDVLQRPLLEMTPAGASVAVHADPESLALAAAALVVDEARRAVRDRGRFTIALAGGSTPEAMYRLLAGPPYTDLMPWSQTHVFWGDERCVDSADPRSNERAAREALLDHVPVPTGNIHPMSCTGAGGAGGAGSGAAASLTGEAAPGEAAARRAADEYEKLLRRVFPARTPASRGCGGRATATKASIDLVLLGMGDNGHTASLFPGSAVLDETERWAMADIEDPGTAAATSGAGERLWRVTLTAPFINRARTVAFMVSGAGKAAAVRDAVTGQADPHRLPALLIRPESGRLMWLLDEAAAARLPRGAAPTASGAIESYDDLPSCEGGPSR